MAKIRPVLALVAALLLVLLSTRTAAAQTISDTATPAVSTSSEQSERSRVRTHLLAAEAVLRERDLSELPRAQANARLRSLDVLHRYAERSVFPRNLAFARTRAPYFIDDGGRACAVAELIIASGHREIASEVAARENNAYVMEMETPALLEWAATSGFSIDELAYIQPDYCELEGAHSDGDCIYDHYSWNPSSQVCTPISLAEDDGLDCHLENDEPGRCENGICEPLPSVAAEPSQGDCGVTGRAGRKSQFGAFALLALAIIAGTRRRGHR